jgi:hypothetical protein
MAAFRITHWVIMFVACILQVACLSFVLYCSSAGVIGKHPEFTAPFSLIALIIVSTLCVIVFLSFVSYALSPSADAVTFRRWFSRNVRRHASWTRVSNFFGAYGIIIGQASLIILCVLGLSLVLLVGWYAWLVPASVLPELPKSPGIFFAVVTGVIGVAGFMITVRKIKESHNFITNYQSLLDLATKRLTEAQHDVLMFGVTPLHGNVSQGESRLFQKYHRTLMGSLAGNGGMHSNLKVICYKGSPWTDVQADKSPLQLYYEQLEPAAERQKGYDQALSFLDAMRTRIQFERANVRAGGAWAVSQCSHSLLEVVPDATRKFPGYRALITDKTAIVYLPIDIGSPTGGTEHLFEMIGFETQTPYVVEMLRNQHEALWSAFRTEPTSRLEEPGK